SPELEEELAAADLLVQTTPAGMSGEADAVLPVPESWLRPPLIVCDIVYTPPETPLLAAARRRGLRVVPGWGCSCTRVRRPLSAGLGVRRRWPSCGTHFWKRWLRDVESSRS